MSEEKPPPPPGPPPTLVKTPAKTIKLKTQDPKKFEKGLVRADASENKYNLEFVTKGSLEECVVVYRYGNKFISDSYTSKKRLNNNDTPIEQMDLNGILNEHTHRIPSYSPFVSVVLDYDQLYKVLEPQARDAIESAFHLLVFHVPLERLYRPVVCSAATKKETEWCVLDYPERVSDLLVSFRPNPYGKMRMFRLLLSQDANKLQPPIRASLNKSPQFVKVDVGGEYPWPAYHWAWEKGDLLRVEAAAALENAQVRKTIVIQFPDHRFELKILKIIPV